MADKKVTVAVYDFRSKQEYIYRTNRLREIMGASNLIVKAFDEAIGEHGKICNNLDKPNVKFPLTAADFEDCDKSGEVLYKGGGNIVIIFKDRDAMKDFNRAFSKWLINHAPGLSPLCGFAEFDDLSKMYFRDVTKKVFDNLNEYKKIAPPMAEADVLPVTQTDRKTGLPAVTRRKESWVSRESEAKLDAYNDDVKKEDYAKNLDDLVTSKGTESLLAIVYADGNAMGQKVQDYIGKDVLFEEGVKKQRKLTEVINNVYVKWPIEKIESTITGGSADGTLAMRRIVGAGDEITIICNARKAKAVAEAYFESLGESNDDSEKSLGISHSACMGIAIFHSHAPFSDVYEMAEQCCESGKKRIKVLCKDEKTKNRADNCYIDAYFCRSAITGELDELRHRKQREMTNMPFCIRGIDRERDYWKNFERVGQILSGLARSKVKTLRDAAYSSPAAFELEFDRIASSNHELKPEDIRYSRAYIADVADFFDIWFVKEQNDG